MVVQNFAYDANGAEAGTSTASGTSTNGWDFEGKLTQTALSDTNGNAAGGSANVFDAAGNRLAHTDSLGKTAQKTTSYLLEGESSNSQVIEERAPDVNDAAGQPALQARYVWGQGLSPLAMWRKSKDGTFKLFFHLSDGQESVRQLTDASGAVVDSYFYDAWGNTLDGSSNHVANPFRYTGQQLDADGKYYLRARFYNPGTGRFLSHDPLMGNDDDPASLHRYLYAGGDGVNGYDPSGQDTLPELQFASYVSAGLVGTYDLMVAEIGEAIIGNFAQESPALQTFNAGLASDVPAAGQTLENIRLEANTIWRRLFQDAVAAENLDDIVEQPLSDEENLLELRRLRTLIGRPYVGSLDRSTVRNANSIEGTSAKLIIGGRQFWDMQGGTTPAELKKLGLGNRARTHAESNVFFQAYEANLQKSSDYAVLYVDREPCDECMPDGLLRLMKWMGVRTLRIVYENGYASTNSSAPTVPYSEITLSI